MLVLGIDPGTARTGYGLLRRLEDSSLEVVDFGVISTPSDQPMVNRLKQLYSTLLGLLERHQPASAAVEQLYIHRNVSSAISVGQARGVILLALAQAEIPVEEYSPKEVKLAITGFGQADKGQMQRMVQALLSMDELPRPDDAADALAVAICHAHTGPMRARLEGSS